MKKVLAIALAVIMALSMFSIAASAATLKFEELPVFPTQEKGRIYFAADNITYEYGTSPAGTYEVPVYVVSDYDASCEVGFVELGCIIGLEGDTSMATILDVKPSAELEALPGYVNLDTGYGESDWFFDATQGHIAFKVDGDAILHQAKFKVATITLQINDNFVYEPGSSATAPYVIFDTYDFSNIYDNTTAEGVGAIFDKDVIFGDEEAFYYLEATEYLEKGVGNDGNLFWSFAFIAEEPEVVVTWPTDLLDWFAGILDQFFEIFTTIHNFIQDALGIVAGLL